MSKDETTVCFKLRLARNDFWQVILHAFWHCHSGRYAYLYLSFWYMHIYVRHSGICIYKIIYACIPYLVIHRRIAEEEDRKCAKSN